MNETGNGRFAHAERFVEAAIAMASEIGLGDEDQDAAYPTEDQCISGEEDFIIKEERRRTYWALFREEVYSPDQSTSN